jgi:hypothetical protein
MCIELKIKSKHLALEPGIIKLEERKLLKQIRHGYDVLARYHSLVIHRKTDVRNEARATQLAIAYLKGKPYSKVELKRATGTEYLFQNKILPRVHIMVRKYGTTLEQRKIEMDTLREWSRING